MAADAEPEPIMRLDGVQLGLFLPGLGYWVTPQNIDTAYKVLAEGRARIVEPASQAGLVIGAGGGEVAGAVEIRPEE